MRDKSTPTTSRSLRLLIGAEERIAVSRCDSAHDLTLALENSTVTCLTITPFSLNANLSERMRQTFADLMAVHYAQSGFTPYWRPVLAIGAAQSWNACGSTVRRDVDGIEPARPPWCQRRHTLNYQPFGSDILLPGMCVNIVLPQLKQKAGDKIFARGQEHIFICYYEQHGVFDGSVLTVPLAALLSGTESFALQRSQYYRTIGESSFPLARMREWHAIIRSPKLWTTASQQELVLPRKAHMFLKCFSSHLHPSSRPVRA